MAVCLRIGLVNRLSYERRKWKGALFCFCVPRKEMKKPTFPLTGACNSYILFIVTFGTFVFHVNAKVSDCHRVAGIIPMKDAANNTYMKACSNICVDRDHPFVLCFACLFTFCLFVSNSLTQKENVRSPASCSFSPGVINLSFYSSAQSLLRDTVMLLVNLLRATLLPSTLHVDDTDQERVSERQSYGVWPANYPLPATLLADAVRSVRCASVIISNWCE